MEIIFVLIGAVLGWLGNDVYHRKAAEASEAQHRLTMLFLTTVLTTMERNGEVKLTRDAKGNLTGGVIVEMQAQGSGVSIAGCATLTDANVK